jgi:glycosyltransferase involved in cell wall biosynthesis
MAPVATSRLDATVLICTYNRAALLGEMLDSLAQMRDSGRYRWDVLTVDNNSSDDTRHAVESRQARFPVPLRYLFEGRQGKSHALNTGISATDAEIVIFTDDDQRVTDHWVDQACASLLSNPDIGYAGGPVWPIWDAPRPPWLSLDQPDLLGPLGLFDYGREPFIFEERRRAAGGGNLAVRRSVFSRSGGFSHELGRTGASLLGQEQAEFYCRTRAAGIRGMYVPSMEVFHHVPASRMTRGYLRRWWFWRGISRARLDRMHAVTEEGVDLRRVPCVAGVPRFMIADTLRLGLKWGAALATASAARRLTCEQRLAYHLGYIKERQRGTVPRSRRATALSGS